jgi:hypothetical protein
MKKVISFSLWGDKPKYTVGAVRNADLALEVYPGWICRYYVGKCVPLDTVNSLIERENTEVFVMNRHGDWTSSFWRFYAASDPEVDIMLSRDTDSRLNARERAAVDDWLSGNKLFHIMRDHPFHSIEILAGMWGVRNGIPDLKESILRYKKSDFWQIDQNFLKEEVFPAIINNVCIHDEFFSNSPFPKSREGLEFVGQVFDENEETVREHLDALERHLSARGR